MKIIPATFTVIFKVLSFQFMAIIFWTKVAFAQGMMGGESCAMCGTGMVFGWIFMLAVAIGVVVLVVTLLRRGRHSKTGPHT